MTRKESRGIAADDPELYSTCMFTSYMTDYMPAIIREINSLYDVDAHFMNGWPPLGQPADLPLRRLPEIAAVGNSRLLGQIQ